MASQVANVPHNSAPAETKDMQSAVKISSSLSPGDLSKTADTAFQGANAQQPTCICNRPKTKVMCRRCSFTLDPGRARRPCNVHPKKLGLMDLSECPRCRASSIWLSEFSR